MRLESIIDRTFSLHVWHPTDSSATRRWRDGPNVAYFLRHGRLTACRRGLVARPAQTLRWGLPADLAATKLGLALDSLLVDAPRSEPGEPCEIDVVVRPGRGKFIRPAECRLLLVTDNSGAEAGIRRRADRIESIDSQAGSLAALLETIG